MKKSLRILSLVLAVVMIMTSASVAGSAYEAYKGTGANITYDDVNSAVYTTEQYASMALDEVDRLLDANAMVLDIYVGTLNISSIDGTLASVISLLSSVSSLLDAGILGDAALLKAPIKALETKGTSRSKGDTQVIYDLLDLIGGLAPLASKYVNGSISLGILNSFIANYVFDVRELVFGLLSGLTGLAKEEFGDDIGWDYYITTKDIPSKYKGTGTALIFAQDVLNTLVLGEWKQLDGLFYEMGDHTSHVAYQEIQFHDGSATGAILPKDTPLDTDRYDYYGWVHPDNWVTVGLGDFIRVNAGAAAPKASYQNVNLQNLSAVYPFVEAIFLQAYNGILVPVLNRITKSWIRQSLGYTFDDNKTTEFQYDANGEIKLDANGDAIINPDYDYLYQGDAPEVVTGEKIFRIFDAENLTVPYYEVQSAGYDSFVSAFNHNLGLFVDGIINVTSASKVGNTTTYTWSGTNDEGEPESYSFSWTDGSNSYLVANVCSALKFLINVTGDEFFDQGIIERGEMKTPAEVDALGNQALLAYVLRSVINANVPYIYIPENNYTNTMAGVGLEACMQLAYQDIPQFTYTAPNPLDYADPHAYNVAVVEKGLAILMDVAAYNINSILDTEYATATDANYNTTNNGTVNRTGLLGYLGDSGVYGTTVAAIAAWAVSTWASTIVPGENGGKNQCLLSGYDFQCDNWDGQYGAGKVTEATVWSDLDALLNLIIPVSATYTSTSSPDNRPWLHADIASTSGSIVKTIIFDYILYPVLELNVTNLEKILSKNNGGALAFDNIETVLVDTIHRLFDVLFPDVFDHSVTSIDTFLNNEKLAAMVNGLIVTLSATLSTTSPNGNTIQGKGKILTGVALPIVCMILGLSDKQEFAELESYLPSTVSAADGSVTFSIYNGSQGVNTSYRDPNANFKRKVDSLYTYTITGVVCNIISGGSGTLTYTGVTPNTTTLAGGESKSITINNLQAGQMLEVTIQYKVKDENGQWFNGGNALSSTKYCYVGATDKGDDEALATETIGNQTIQYNTDVYLGAGRGLSSVDSYAFRITDSASSATNVTVTGVSVAGNSSWIGLTSDTAVTSQTLSGEGGTYVFTPFKVNDDNFKRTEFEYAKDEDGAYVEDAYGMRVKTGVKPAEAGVTYIPDGDYTVTTTINVGGTTGTITTRVHLYDDFGLSGLVNSCVGANRSTSTISSAGQAYWSAYYNALKDAAAFVLQPNTHGATFNSYIGTTGNGTANETNNYLTKYRALYTATETIKKYELSSGADALWNTVNQYLPYNYVRSSYTAAGSDGDVTVYYQNYKEYYEAGYQFVGQRNYVGHTYRTFKDAVNYANGLIDREYKWVWKTAEEYANMSAADKEAFKGDVDWYKNEVDNKGSISSVEAAYATHMLELTYGRLIPIAGNKSKLQAAIANFGGVSQFEKSWSTGSWAAYANAVAFATSTNSDSTATAEQINWALSKLVKAWKDLAVGADYSALTAAINAAKGFLVSDCDSWGLNNDNSINVEDAENQEIYTAKTFAAFLDAIRAGDVLVNDNANNKGLAAANQDIIDRAVAAITDTQAALLPFGTPDGPDGPDEPQEVEFEIIPGQEIFGNGATYAPVINEDVYDVVELDSYTVDGETYAIDGVIFGIPQQASSDDVIDLFTIENGTVEIIEAKANICGTGSLFVVRDTAGNVVKTYVVAYRGDLNSDADVTSPDVSLLNRCTSITPGYIYDEPTEPEDVRIKFAAADITGDGQITTADLAAIKYIQSESKPVDQGTGKYAK